MRPIVHAVLLLLALMRPGHADGGLSALGIAVETLLSGQIADEPPPGEGLQRPANALRDGQPALGTGDIAEVWLIDPTERYGHAVLGDAVEAGGLLAVMSDGRRLTLQLDANSVFEDLVPRLADLDGDGADEIIVVRAYLDSGAALAVYGVKDSALGLVAETSAIGTPNRWLNPVGVADLDGDGALEVAYVETPHIGGTLRIFGLHDEGLIEEGQLHGFSNHAIGARALGLSALLDVDGDGAADMLVPDAARRALRIVSFAGGRFEELARIQHDARIDGDFLIADYDGRGRLDVIYPLADGRRVLLRR